MHYAKEPPPEDTGEVSCEESEMPYCCGIVVLGHARDDRILLGEALSDIDENVDDCDRGLYLYTLNQEQEEEAAQLLKAGFEVLTTFVSPTSGNTITLYGKKHKQPKPRRQRATAARRRRR